MKRTLFFSLLLMLASTSGWSQPDIQVQGLFAGRAVLNIEGNLRMLSDGDTSPEGVELIKATSTNALIRYQGQEFELDLSSRISASFTQAESRDVRLMADSRGHYITQARINGRSVEVMLDTGATSIAMNSIHAELLGIDYKSGPTVRVSTAGGNVMSHQVQLRSVQVGDITVNSVTALVTEGSSPDIILLGNTFLSRVQMRNEGSIMVLSAPF